MKRKIQSAMTFVGLFTLMTITVASSPILLSEDFDTLSPGTDLSTQTGWSLAGGTGSATVVTDPSAQSGGQSVTLAQNTILDRDLSTLDNQSVVWTVTHFRGAGTSAAPTSYPSSPPASAIVHFSSSSGIMLGDGDGTGGASFATASGFDTLNPSQWYEIIIRQDYNLKKWDCWINGTLVGHGLGFRDDSVTRLNGFRQYAGAESSMDTFFIRRRSNGDLDLDGDSDASDLVLNVNAVQSNPADPIAFDDADYDQSGTIDNADVTDVAGVILGL